MTAVGATAVGVTAVRNNLEFEMIINIRSTIIIRMILVDMYNHPLSLSTPVIPLLLLLHLHNDQGPHYLSCKGAWAHQPQCNCVILTVVLNILCCSAACQEVAPNYDLTSCIDLSMVLNKQCNLCCMY